jgi:AbrB family looped-hinge helix DNA binding protein
MATAYTTMTAKGQITLPSELRRRFGLEPGQRLAISADGGHIRIAIPQGIEAVRAEIRRQAESAGTWGTEFDVSDGWASAAADRLGRPDA